MMKLWPRVWSLIRSPWFQVPVMAICMQYLEYHGWFANVEGYALNVYQRGNWHEDPSPRIITIGINRYESEHAFGGKSPLASDAVRSLVAAIQKKNPGAVGVDLITDEKGYEQTDPQLPWPKGAAPDPDASSIVWAAGASEARVERAPFLQRLVNWRDDQLVATPRPVLGRDPADKSLGFGWGLPVYAYDDDGVVRRLPRQWSVDSTISFENTFARQVARAYCRARHDTACDRRDDAEEVFLPFDNEDLWKNHYAVGDLFRCTFDESRVCSDWFEEKGKGIDKITDWENTIVILGAHFPDMNDWHRTPIDERTPGLLVNASAVRAEISGPRLQGFSHLAGFGLDLLLGGIAAVLVDFLKARGYRLRSRTLASIGLGVAAVGFGYLLFLLTEMLWVSWVGMLMTGVSWDAVLEVLFHDPHDRDSSPTPPVTAPA